MDNTPRSPESVTNLLNRLRRIKDQRAALDKEETDIVATLQAQLAAQRQQIAAAEQELEKIAPHLLKKETKGRKADMPSPPTSREILSPR